MRRLPKSALLLAVVSCGDASRRMANPAAPRVVEIPAAAESAAPLSIAPASEAKVDCEDPDRPDCLITRACLMVLRRSDPCRTLRGLIDVANSLPEMKDCFGAVRAVRLLPSESSEHPTTTCTRQIGSVVYCSFDTRDVSGAEQYKTFDRVATECLTGWTRTDRPSGVGALFVGDPRPDGSSIHVRAYLFERVPEWNVARANPTDLMVEIMRLLP